MAKMEMLRDDFSNPTLDTGKWTTTKPAQVSIIGGKLALQRDVSSGVISVSALANYDLSGSYIAAKIIPPVLTGFTNYETSLEVFATGGTGHNAKILIVNDTTYGTALRFSTVDASTFTVRLSIAYNPSAHAWLRIREASGVLFLDASADGTNWSNLYSGSHSLSTLTLNPQFTQYLNPYISDRYLYVDNVNVAPNPGAFLPFFI